MSNLVINTNDLKPLIYNILKEMVEEPVKEDLTYDELKSSPKLEALRNSIDNNKTVSIVFVKKDGSVRPMAFRKNFNYDFKRKDVLGTQSNNSSNNLLKGYDINVYIKAKRETGDAKEAATRSWRAIKLETVLGFLAGGKFIDLREENRIIEKFGESVYNQLTKSMTAAANSALINANEAMASVRDTNSFTNECSNKDVSIEESIRKEVKKHLSESTKRMRNFIYKSIDKMGITKRMYNDVYWAGVRQLVDTIRQLNGVTDVSLGAKDGGYRSNKEGTQWKEYQLTIETMDGIIEGHINAHAAGTVEDPFKMYDITMTLW